MTTEKFWKAPYDNGLEGLVPDNWETTCVDVVGINLPSIPKYIIAWLGTLKAGCIVSGVSPLLSGEEMDTDHI